jgi:ABC-type bacteriocin/lantibiotic exporter with double-glycine peptidase domain
MKKNMGTLDKVLRILVAAVIVGLFFAHVLLGIVGIVLLVLAGIFIVTSVIGFCPLYLPFGISTKKNKKEIQPQDKI